MNDPMPAIRGILGMPELVEPVDHVAESAHILAEPAFRYAEANDPHGAAQAHALLALAEQHRLANLITYWVAVSDPNDTEPSPERLAELHTLQQRIEKELGL